MRDNNSKGYIFSGSLLLRSLFKRSFVTGIFFACSASSFAQTRDMDYFITQSLQNDPRIYELRNQILQNKLDSQLIVAGNKWQVTGSGNAYYAPIVNGWGYDEVITNGQQLSALVALNKNIYNKRNLNLQFESLQLQNDSINNTIAINNQNLKRSITSQYITTYGDQLQLGINDEVIQLLGKEEKILKLLTQKNVYKQADYLSFLVTLQQQQLARNQLQVQYKMDYDSLNYLSGIVDTSTTTLEAPNLQVIPNLNAKESPFFLSYYLDSLRIENERNLAIVEYRPKVNLFADAGYQSAFQVTPYKNFGYSFGINLTVPIFNGGQKQLAFEKLKIRENSLQRKRDFFSRQYDEQLEELQQQLNELKGLSVSINKQIDYLETLIKVNGKLLETGDIRIADYVLAVNNYITAKNLVVQNQIAQYQVIQQLNYWNMNL